MNIILRNQSNSKELKRSLTWIQQREQSYIIINEDNGGQRKMHASSERSGSTVEVTNWKETLASNQEADNPLR